MSGHILRRKGLAALGVLCALVTSCGVPSQSSQKPINESDIPAGLRPLDPDAETESNQVQRIDVWFVREGHLASVSHLVISPASPSAVLADLLAGPTDFEQSRSLRSAIPDPDVVNEVVIVRGVATVAISAGFTDIPANDQVLAIGQVVLTLTGLPGVGRVRFAIDENIVAVPLPSGDATNESVSRDDFADLMDPVGSSAAP